MPENKIRRRVVTKESGSGIPDVLVVIHDVDPELEKPAPSEAKPTVEPKEGLENIAAQLEPKRDLVPPSTQ